MLIKYQTLDGTWRTIDGVSEVINHGYCEDPVIYNLAAQYDGNDVQIHHAALPVNTLPDGNGNAVPTPDGCEDGRVRFYLVPTIRGQRQHWAISDIRQGFLMADDGATVDRLLH